MVHTVSVTEAALADSIVRSPEMLVVVVVLDFTLVTTTGQAAGRRYHRD